MHTGTISDFDSDGQYGLIAADDGQMVLFNLWAIEQPLRDAFRIGARVEFASRTGAPAPRALGLTLVRAPGRSIDEQPNLESPNHPLQRPAAEHAEARVAASDPARDWGRPARRPILPCAGNPPDDDRLPRKPPPR